MSVSPTLLANAGSTSSVAALPGSQPAAQIIASATMTRLGPSISLPAISRRSTDCPHLFHRHNIVVSAHESRSRVARRQPGGQRSALDGQDVGGAGREVLVGEVAKGARQLRAGHAAPILEPGDGDDGDARFGDEAEMSGERQAVD